MLSLQKEHIVSDEQITILCQQVLLAGSDTNGSTLTWLVLLMANNPDAQQKVQAEIDRESDPATPISYADRNKYTYLQNVIRETFRYRTVAPLMVPHANQQPLEVGKYVIPANSSILPLVWSWNLDPEVWGADAKVFRPERWESATEEQLSVPLVFGLGPRECVGRPLAEQVVFLFAWSLLRNFSFQNPIGSRCDETPVFGLTYQPKPFSVRVISRNLSEKV